MALSKEKFISRGGIYHKLSGRKSKLSVGFEWEVPAKKGSPLSWATMTTKEKLTAYPGKIYSDCGGIEFTSPVFSNLGEARAFSKSLKKEVKKLWFLRPRAKKNSHNNGIHVHVSGFDSSRPLREWIALLMNKDSSKDFVWNLSGRGNTSYRHQAVSDCWDTRHRNRRHHTLRSSDSFSHYRLDMLRANSFNMVSTLEFRMFNSHEDILDVALEFSLAMVRFAELNCHKGFSFKNYAAGHHTHTIEDFKTWVYKQRGYPNLKAHKVMQKEK